MTYNHTRDALVTYLNRKVEEQDWTAVSDAANDLSIFDILEARSPQGSRSESARGAVESRT